MENPAARVVTRVPVFPPATGLPFRHRNRFRPSREVAGGAGSVPARRFWPGPPAGLAHTIHSPAVISQTLAVSETGPPPGTTGPMVSTFSKRSPCCGRPLTPARRPEKLTDAG